MTQGGVRQQVQAAAGCTFQVPLENVVLTNITQTAGGIVSAVPFDRTIPTLNSNGTVVCLVPARQRLLSARALQTATSSSSVDVFVMILSPSNDLLALNSSALMTLVQTSYALQTVSSSVGSTGVTVLSINDALGSSSSGPTTAASGTTNNGNVGLIVGLSIFAGVCLVVAGVAVAAYQRQQKTVPFSRSKVVMFVDNPATADKTSSFMMEPRMEFAPSTVRLTV
jgi:hypothetical protein